MSGRLAHIEGWARGGFLRQGQDRGALERDVLLLVEIARAAQKHLKWQTSLANRNAVEQALRDALARLERPATTEQP